jgi:hypothetical protein
MFHCGASDISCYEENIRQGRGKVPHGKVHKYTDNCEEDHLSHGTAHA